MVARIEATRRALETMTVAELAALHWYALMTAPQAEFAVEANLEQRGLVAVVPKVTRYRRVNHYAKQKTEISFPLVARYVFVGFDAGGDAGFVPPWHRVFELTMVKSVVGAEGRPWRMHGGQVATFLRHNGVTQSPEAERHMRSGKEFGEGDMVDIVDGAFRGFTVKVHAIEGAEAKVLLPLFGGQDGGTDETAHLVPVPLGYLERA